MRISDEVRPIVSSSVKVRVGTGGYVERLTGSEDRNAIDLPAVQQLSAKESEAIDAGDDKEIRHYEVDGNIGIEHSSRATEIVCIG